MVFRCTCTSWWWSTFIVEPFDKWMMHKLEYGYSSHSSMFISVCIIYIYYSTVRQFTVRIERIYILYFIKTDSSLISPSTPSLSLSLLLSFFLFLSLPSTHIFTHSKEGKNPPITQQQVHAAFFSSHHLTTLFPFPRHSPCVQQGERERNDT